MVATLYSGFNTQRIGAFACKLTSNFVTDATVTIADGTYSHVDLSTVMGTGKYVGIGATLEAALYVTSPPEDFDVSFSTTTRTYSFQNAGARVKLDFTSASNGAGGPRLAKALGLTASNPKATSGSGYDCVIECTGVGSNIDFASDVLPYYLVPLARDEPSHYSRPYEPTGMVKRKTSTNGNVYSVEPLTLPEYLDLSTEFMPLANVFADDAAAAQPWTVQHLVRHARAHEPVLFDFVSSGDLVCKLGESDASFGKDLRELAFAQPDYHGMWRVKFSELLYLGRL